MKVFTSVLCLFGLITVLTGCATPGPLVNSSITPEVRNAIAYCSAGIASETGLKIEAAIVENGGKIDTVLHDKITGVFASIPGVTEANAVASQKLYMDCLDKKTSQEKTSSIEACHAKLACEIDTMQQFCNCRTIITEMTIEKGYSDSFGDKMLKERCYSGQYDLRECWNGEDVNMARASCTVLLQSNGRELPKAMTGTCLTKQKD
ncbi:hypothetical protein Ping_1584 [Psychromonas ingrahamii 37]|uniref:Lipoprotein n=1 Tax=Psychromonas ingrahamii (strain DSM 17664 / CCUG 51855 / 37) TaxID=357804 RepID=A1SV67_PSYIN|nr:hypothetical protein [Psychromonas ingrahamii]ABM03382.1 hypothetical protein Ping_1584 [Psychromonas ingrahamii 37]